MWLRASAYNVGIYDICIPNEHMVTPEKIEQKAEEKKKEHPNIHNNEIKCKYKEIEGVHNMNVMC